MRPIAAGRQRRGSNRKTRQRSGYSTKVMRPALRRCAGVDVLAVADADAEAGDAGVEHFDALAAWCGPQRSEKAVGDHFFVAHVRLSIRSASAIRSSAWKRRASASSLVKGHLSLLPRLGLACASMKLVSRAPSLQQEPQPKPLQFCRRQLVVDVGRVVVDQLDHVWAHLILPAPVRATAGLQTRRFLAG